MNPRRPGRAADIARALASLVVLAALLIGIPVLLLLVAPTLGMLTGGWAGLARALTRPDDGHLFLAALTLVAWAAWAVFALSVALEAVAVARGLPTPRLPALAGPQRFAASLVASAAMLLSTPTATSPAPATSVTLVEPAHLPAPPSAVPPPVAPDHGDVASVRAATPAPLLEQRSAAVSPGTHHVHHREITVRRGDTLWDFAAIHLGDGARYREIARLNYGRPQPDGRTLTDAHWIYPGWTLLLPDRTTAPAAKAPSPPSATSPDGRTKVGTDCVVQPGDTLWDIAAAHLGDPLRYREIYQLNHGRPQPDGRSLDDPRLIVPGWTLALPPRHRSPQTSPPAPMHSQPKPDNHAAAPSKPATPAPSSVPLPHRELPPDPATGVEGPRTGATAAAPTPPTATAFDPDGLRVDVSRLVLGLTALTATGFLAELARRRRRQQQQRRPGQRIPLPTGEPAAAERRLRSAQIPITLATVTAALTQLADNARSTGVRLPRVLAVLVGPHDVDLVVDDDQPPIAPFAATGAPAAHNAAVRTWALAPDQLDADGDEAQSSGQIPCSAYPALVALGTVEDRMLLINIEAAGSLHIDLGPDRGDAIIRTLAVELATSPTSAGISLILPSRLSDLADVADPDRVAAVDTSAGTRRAAVRQASVRAALDAEAAPDLHEARVAGIVSDAWTPEIYIGIDSNAEPWSGIVTIHGTSSADGAENTWTLLSHAGAARLEPLGITVTPSQLSDTDYASLLALLDTGTKDPEPPIEEALTQSQAADARPMHLVEAADRLATERLPRAAALTSRRQVVLAALPDPTIHGNGGHEEQVLDPDAPRILLLGRVEVVGASTPSTPRRGRSLELLAYLALHPGATPAEIDEALWPGQRVTDDMRNSLVSRTRTWLGTAPDGTPYLSHVTAETGYRLQEAVTTDWHQFVRLAREALFTDEPSVPVLQKALELVRGRPFLGVDPAAYAWAEGDLQTMVSAVVDVAAEAVVRAHVEGDVGTARCLWARALTVDSANEVMHRLAIQISAEAGDHDEADRLVKRLRERLRAVDPDADLDDEILKLVR